MQFQIKSTQKMPHLLLNAGRSWLLPSLIIGLIYVPLLLEGGIITDDWGDILQTWNCQGFMHCYGAWFPLFSNRPLAPLPITLSTQLFTTHYAWYLFTNTSIYIAALVLTAHAFKSMLSLRARQIFFILAAVPCIAMPLVVSPINQLTATLAFLYWAISLILIQKYSRTQEWFWYGLGYLSLLCGFLTYEIILPLLFFTAFLPALENPATYVKRRSSYFFKYIAPILLVLLLVIVWQKILAPQFIEVFSRLNFNAAHVLPILYTWVKTFALDLPSLFLKALAYLSFYNLLTLAIISILLVLGYREKIPARSFIFRAPFLILSACAFLSSALIFILSDAAATPWGYQARGLSSAWFTLAIFIAALLQSSQALSKTIRASCFVLALLFTCFSALSFSIQRDKYIESWQLQLHIIHDAVSLIQTQKIGPNASIIGNVPRYAPNNYNRELVFSQSWDFPAALVLYAQDQIRGGLVIDSRGKDLQNLRVDNDKASVNDQGIVDFTNLWLYDFEPKTNKGMLMRIPNPQALDELIKQWQLK